MANALKAVLAVSWLTLAMGVAFCDRQPAQPPNSILGWYELVGFDSKGNKIVEGTIRTKLGTLRIIADKTSALANASGTTICL